MAVETITVTREQVKVELDRAARERFNLSGDEFIERYRSNLLDLTTPAVSRLAMLVRLVEERDDLESAVSPAVRRRRFRFRAVESH